MRFFGLFSKSRIQILVLKRQNVEDNSAKQAQKTVGLILFKKLRYLSKNVVFLAKWTLWSHILSILHDLWPLYLYGCPIMMNPNRPHGYLLGMSAYSSKSSQKLHHLGQYLAKWTLFHHILSFLHHLWPLEPDERLIMMNSIRPHGYLMKTCHYTINRAFNSVKMDHFRANWEVFLYNYRGETLI